MTRFKKQITINAPNDTVWEVISNLGDIYKFNPGVRKSYYTSDHKEGVGAARICELYPAGKILETARRWTPRKEILLEIQTIEKAPPVKHFTGHFQLENPTANQTIVSVTINYQMKLGVIGELLNQIVIHSKMEKGIEELLEGLRLHIEKGMEVPDTKFLYGQLKVA